MAVNIRLPWPPSLNRSVRHTGNGHYVSKAGKQFRAAAIAEVWSQLGVPIAPLGRCRIALQLTPPTRQKRDADNHIKPVLDALVHAKLIADDNQRHVKEVRAEWTDVVESPGCCDVFIEEL